MPTDRDNPNAPRADGSPETPASERGESVGPGQTTEGGTLRQDAPPTWAMGEPSASESRSGQGIYELNRELERGRSDGADSAEGYELIRKLGTGAFGAVWEAENRLTRERVAIKFFTAGADEWASMLGEVGLLQTVEGCRGIVLVKEVRQGDAARRPHYVMQLANCGSLADWLKAASTLPPRERLKASVGFFTRVARAMAAVHRRGIHHCDLKPQNILLHAPEPGAAPEPLVADFGQAHFATDDTPSLGTFFYMPPDQIEAAQASTPTDTRWDVYALGAICYEMLTGEPPRRSPELVDRIKKAPKHLATKMAVYREGIVGEPTPAAHHAVADPMLARIVSRCLSLDPEDRPTDAGALVALLDGRARWRRTRPILALAAAATLLLVGIVTGLGLWAANKVTERTKRNVTTEVAGSLARTAGYGTRAIEDRLQRYVVSLDNWADDIHERAPVAVAAMRDASLAPRGAKLDGNTPLADAGHAAVRTWLQRVHAQRKNRAAPGEHIPTLGVMLVADGAGGGPQSRGFYVARVQQNGTIDDAARAATPQDREFFTTDFSYRDYFHAGPGEADDAGAPHAVVRAAHISHPFRSRGVDRVDSGDLRQRWKLNVVSPIWDDPAPDKRQRVIGLLVLGLDVELDIKPLLYPTEFQRPSGPDAGYGIDQLVKIAVTDDRGRWVWHPDCQRLLDSDLSEFRFPRTYPELARKHHFTDERAGPWLTLDAPAAGDPHGYRETDAYVDPLEAEMRNDQSPEIACFTRFDPYVRSRYSGVDATGKPSPPRRWVFVAQVDRKSALRPLDEMQGDILGAGMVVVFALTLIAAGLWFGLVTVLRRLEFAAHG